ncbi:MAG TPA: hypothetical protein VEY92_08565 [Pseudoxanthomonas sp.]|nr:hypothetical protein [Pseudoxanthomonas sp.]
MSRFFVGQRVRMARPVHEFNLGATGRIKEFFDEVAMSGGRANCFVLWDRPVIGWLSHTDQLEPILPDGHRPAELSVEELLPFLSGVSA